VFVAAAAEIRKRQEASGGAGEGQWPFRLRAKMLQQQQQQQQQQQRGRSGDLALLRKNGGENAEDEAAAASDSLAALDGGAAMKLGAHFLTLKFSGPMPEGFVGGQRAGGGGPEVEGGDDEPGEEQGQLNAIAAAAAATKRLNIAALPPHSLARGRLVAAFRKELGLRIFGGDVSDGASGAARIRVLGLRAGSVVVCFEFTEAGEAVPYVAEANVGERGDDEERAEEEKAEEGGEGGAEEGGAAAGSEAAAAADGDGGGDAAADDEADTMSRADAEARLKELLLQGQLHDDASAEASAYKLLPMLDSRDPTARHLRHRLREGRAAASAAGSGGTLKLLLRVPLVQVGVLKKGSAARAKVRPLAAPAGC